MIVFEDARRSAIVDSSFCKFGILSCISVKTFLTGCDRRRKKDSYFDASPRRNDSRSEFAGDSSKILILAVGGARGDLSVRTAMEVYFQALDR